MSNKKPYFPFFVDISKARGIIIGGGKAAYEKMLCMRPFGAELTLIAPEFIPEIEAEAEHMGGINLIRRNYTVSDFSPEPDFVVAASDKEEEKKFISDYCMARRIPVNVVDAQAYCSYIYPAMVTKGALSIGISTAGVSPAAASIIKEGINEWLPDKMDEILDWLEEIRPLVMKQIPDKKRRRDVFRKLVKTAMAQERVLTEEEVESIMMKMGTIIGGGIYENRKESGMGIQQ